MRFTTICRERQEEIRSRSTSELTKEDKRRSAESLPARPFNLECSSNRDELSSSQPNVSNTNESSSGVSQSTLGLFPTNSLHSPNVFRSPSPQGSVQSLNSSHSKDSVVDKTEASDTHESGDHSDTRSITVKGTTTTSSLTDGLADSVYSDSGSDLSTVKDRSYSSSSRDTLLSKDSGFSNSSSRDTTPVKDSDSPKGSKETLDNKSSPIDTETSTDQTIGVQQHENWSEELDSTIQEIMKDVHSLEKQQENIYNPKSNKPENLPSVITTKDTPDLVLGLPIGQDSPSPTPSPKSKDDSPTTLSTAEMFANNGQSTIKKGSHVTVPKEKETLYTPSASSTMPRMNEPPNLEQFEMAMKRSQSLTPALRARQAMYKQSVESDKKTPERTEVTYTPEIPIAVLQQKIASVVKPHDASLILRARTPERLVTPEASAQDSHETRQLQTKVDKSKPTVKAKPPVMKKPGKSPDVLKRLKET